MRTHWKQMSALVTTAIVATVAVVAIWAEQWRLAATAAIALLTGLILLAGSMNRTTSGLVTRMRRDRSKQQRSLRHLVVQLDTVEGALERQREVSDARWRGLDESLERFDGRLTALAGELERSLAELTERVDGTVPRVAGEVRSALDRRVAPKLKALRHEPVTEIDALLQLRQRVAVAGEMPLAWGWAMAPRGLLQLVNLIEAGARSIVECGPGTSTIYMALALRRLGRGRVVALEHSSEHAAAVCRHIDRLGLAEFAEVRVAPLVDVRSEEGLQPWYDAASIEDLEQIDLLVVDGPPGATSPLARLPAFPLLVGKLTPGCAIVVDDTRRADEHDVVERWLRDEHLVEEVSLTPDQRLLRWLP